MYRILKFNESVDYGDNFCIRIHNELDYDKLMIKLEKEGEYKWADHNYPTIVSYMNNRDVIWIENKIISRSSLSFYNDRPIHPLIEVDDYLSGVKRKRIENPELDPYGEEDWGYEIQENKNYLYKDLAIYIKTQSEYDLISKKLEELGYNWGNRHILPTDKNYFSNYKNFVLHLNPDNSLSYGNLEFYQKAYPELEIIDAVNYLGDKIGKKIERTDIDPYGEEDWGYEIQENKLNELFETEQAYNYKFVKKRKMTPFVDYIYTFTSRDNIEYYVTLSHNKDVNSMSVKFTDKDHFVGLRNRIKDKYVDMDKFDAINVLNTVVKICKDFYDENKNIIKSFTTSTTDEKRLRVYKYILRKYFKGWEVESYFDPKGGIVINCEPKVNEGHEDIDPYDEEDWGESKPLGHHLIVFYVYDIVCLYESLILGKVYGWKRLRADDTLSLRPNDPYKVEIVESNNIESICKIKLRRGNRKYYYMKLKNDKFKIEDD